ncbi:hypothetical protein KURONO_1858 [Mycobacterium tuberculosis str. Kurono]|nr:hypothetical protein KURONO_1858 [Mycobacterium tuberculosis str. Kurono]
MPCCVAEPTQHAFNENLTTAFQRAAFIPRRPVRVAAPP